MGASLIWGTRQHLLDYLQIQEAVVTASGNYPKASNQNIEEWSGIAIEAIKAKQHRMERKGKLCGIAGAHLDSPQQFTSVIPIAWPPNVPRN